jgi:flagella basal body P-ring formation protein FlgA
MAPGFLLSILILANQPQSLPLAELIVRQAEGHLPPQAIELKVLRLKLPKDLPRQVDPELVQVYFQPRESFSGATVIRIDLPDRQSWISADLELLVKATVARKQLPRGHVLKDEDLEVVPMPSHLLNGATSEPPERLIGSELSSSLKSGEPVLRHQLKRPIVVKRGDRVAVTVEGPSLVVQTTGLAQADGRVGDRIVVRTIASGARLQAEISGLGRVRIQMSGSDPGASP